MAFLPNRDMKDQQDMSASKTFSSLQEARSSIYPRLPSFSSGSARTTATGVELFWSRNDDDTTACWTHIRSALQLPVWRSDPRYAWNADRASR